MNNQMLTEKINKLLLRLSIPAIAAQIVTLLYNTVDRLFIGRMAAGTMAIAGVGVVAPITMILTACTNLFCKGSASLAAISLGKQDQKEAETFLGNSFTSIVLSSILLIAGTLLFKNQLLDWFGASENTIGYAKDYLEIYVLGTLFIQMTIGMNYYITTQGYATTAMVTTMLGAVLNIALDPIFIFGLDMGVKGAALATVIAQGASCLWVLVFLFGKKTKLKIRKECLMYNGDIMKRTLTLGAAPFFMTSSESILHICFNRQALYYGGDLAVSVMTILFTMFQFVNLPAQGFAQGSQPIVGYCYGAGRYERCKETLKTAVKWALSYSIFITACMLIVPEIFIKMFNSNPELVALGKNMLRVYIFGCLVIGANSIYQQTYTSLGDGKLSFFFAFFRKVILLIPLLYLLPVVTPWGVYAVVLAEPISDLLTTLCNKMYFGIFLNRKFGES